MRIVLASSNAKKLAELKVLLAALPVDLVAQGELQIPEAEEPHARFIENALAKARAAAHVCGGAAMADDSGLCVAALGGAPGVISAHFAGALPADAAPDREALRSLQDRANNALLLRQLEAIDDRSARFVSTLVALRSAEDPEPLVAFGRWQGEILRAPRGSGGFGYDPLMWIPALGASVAELDPGTKNRHSHRALAAAQMVALMRAAWGLG
jgi:XTP/dITP diphosphohydrolase